MFKLILTSVLVAFVLLYALRGFQRTLWLLWPIFLLIIPPQVGLFVPLGIGLATCTTVFLIATLGGAVVSLDKHGFATSRMLASDWLVILLYFSFFMTDITTGVADPWTSLIRNATYFAPYLLGRLYLRRLDDFSQCLKPMLLALSLTSIVVVVECVTRINAYQSFFPVSGITGVRNTNIGEALSRFGLRRASGNCITAPSMGVLFVLVSPWASTAYRWSKAGFGPWWWRLPSWLNLLGVLVTLSRGPLLALGLTYYSTFSWYRRLRVPLIAIVLGGIVVLTVYQATFVDTLAAFVGDETTEIRVVNIDGKDYPYNGSRHRMLQWLFYRDAITSAGLFGHGFTPAFLSERPAWGRLWSMDSHFLYLIVLKGFLGLILFVLLAMAGLFNMGKIAWRGDHPLTHMAVCSFGALLATTLNLYTLWLEPTYGVAFFFLIGLSANLRCLPVEPDPHEEEWDEQDEDEMISEWDHHHDPVG